MAIYQRFLDNTGFIFKSMVLLKVKSIDFYQFKFYTNSVNRYFNREKKYGQNGRCPWPRWCVVWAKTTLFSIYLQLRIRSKHSCL